MVSLTRLKLTAVSGLLGVVSALPVHAATLTTSSASFSGTASVTDSCGTVNAASCSNGATSSSPQAITSAAINQFNSSLGVLTGTMISVTSTRTQTIAGSIVAGKDGKNPTTTNGSGTSDGLISAPGASHALTTALTASGTASGATGSFGPTTSNTTTNASLMVGAGSLDSYVGGTTVTIDFSSPTLFSATSTFDNGAKNATTSSATYSLAWSGNAAATYTYSLHATPSFDGSGQLTLTLDFGTLFINQAVAPISFSLYNGNAAGDQVGLDLDSILGSGNTSVLTTNLATFSGLASGASSGYAASFDTSTVGSYAASYQLSLSDANVGAASSRDNYTLTLNLKGNVIPEPGMLGLLGLGMAGLAFAGRRRRA